MATLLQRISLGVGAVVMLIAILASAAVVARSIDSLSTSFNETERSGEATRALVRLQLAVSDAESAQRGFLMTGEPAYLMPYANTHAETDSLLARVDTLLQDRPAQARQVPGLRATVRAKLAEMDETLALDRTQGRAAALRLVRTGRGEALMVRLREQTDRMRAQSRAERRLGSARVARDSRRALWATGLTNAVLLVLLVAGTILLRRLLRTRERFTEGLARSNAQLAQAVAERESALVHVQAMQAQVVQQEKLAGLGRLTAGVAHELKNPLNFINNFSELAAELTDEAIADFDAGRPDDARAVLPDVRDNVGRVQDHGRRADDIVRTMLVHARGVSGERVAVRLQEVLETAVEQAVGPAVEGVRAVRVETDIDPCLDDETLLGIPSALTRLVLNLVENGLHAARERAGFDEPGFEPRVRVAALCGQDRLGHDVAFVTVEDNGAGISDVALPRIFEPFYTTKAPGQGTGLGLSLAYDIAVGHGGSLMAGRAEAGGALFTVTLPLAAESAAAPAEA